MTSLSRLPCDELQIKARREQKECRQSDKPWILVTAILGSSLAFIEGSVVNLALPAIQADLDADSSSLQWVYNAYLLVLGSLMLIGGSLGDHFGIKRTFIFGVGIFGITSIACGLASSLPVLVAARIFQGLGSALLIPASLALIGSHFKEHERGKAIGTWAGASALTTAAGPLIGGWLVDTWSWSAVFFFVPILAIPTIIVGLWRVPKDAPSQKNALDYIGALLLAFSLGTFIYALVSPTSGVTQSALFFTSFILVAFFIWRELRFDSPMLPLDLFRSRAFSGVNLTTFLLYGALSGALYFLPFNLIQIQQYSTLQAGAAFLPLTLIIGFGSTFAGDFIQRFNPRILLTLGPATVAAGFALLAIPGDNAHYLSEFLPGILILGIGMTLSVAPLTTVVMNAVNQHQTGVASGVNNTASRLAGVVAIGALTTLAIGYFGGNLEAALRQSTLDAFLIEELLQQSALLAELKAPSQWLQAAEINQTIKVSYINTFRMLMITSSLLAAMSALIAWVSLASKSKEKSREVR